MKTFILVGEQAITNFQEENWSDLLWEFLSPPWKEIQV